MERDNNLYKKQLNRYLIDHKLFRLVKNDMTYILGAKCSDGVVLVGDTKITVDEGTNYEFGRKLFKPFTSVVMGASGASGLYASFQNRMIVTVREQENQHINLNDHERLKTLAENVIREMHRVYERDRNFLIYNLNVLMGIRVQAEPELVNFTGLGLPEPVNSFKVIGHGEPYGALFVKKMWNPTMTMEQTAKLALFIIKLIQDTLIDVSVGYRTDCLPQVYYIPKVIFPSNWQELYSGFPEAERNRLIDERYFVTYAIRELAPEDVNRFINEVGAKVAEFDNYFTTGQFRI
jgi:20S proteasome alpha/beta subunit